MEKSSQNPPLPPNFRMIDEIVDLLPQIANQQKATIKYFKAEVKAMNQFLDAMNKIKIPVSFPVPLIPLMPKFIKTIPEVSRFQKELTKFYAGAARRMEQLEKDLTSTPKRR